MKELWEEEEEEEEEEEQLALARSYSKIGELSSTGQHRGQHESCGVKSMEATSRQ